MKHRDRAQEQDDLLRPRLVDLIDLRHELVKLATLIDWDWFEQEWAGFFPSKEGRPATHPRLVAGLMYLQHVHRLSDEAVVARWVENPYFQHFTGETFFQHREPIHPSSLSRWRDRIGEEGAEMAQHAQLRIDTGLEIYFCDPQSPWQRGSNENTNGLLRQYFPKGTDLSQHGAEELSAVAHALNTRPRKTPRKTLGWQTPAEALDRLLKQDRIEGVATTG